MHRFQRSGLAAASAVALLLTLAACDRPTVDQSASGRGDAAATGSARAAKETKREAPDATAKAGAAMDRAAESTKSMGAAAAGKVDDATITAKVNAALAKDKELSALKIDADTQNGVVTLSGPAPTASAKEHASEVARAVPGVTSVNNQLTLKTG